MIAAIQEIEYPATKNCVTYNVIAAKANPTKPFPKGLACKPVNLIIK